MMELYSAAFIGFISIIVIIHEIVGKRRKEWQWVVRLAASAVFYAVIAGWRLIFLAFSIATIWYGGKRLDAVTGDKTISSKKQRQRKKRAVVALIVAVNLGILVIAKYLLPVAHHPILLPLGISYYTLMSVSYIVDVYGQKYESEKNIARLALYMTWFPQMLQGPINRYDHMSVTLFGAYHISREDIRKNLLLFMFGALKKYAVANVMIGTVGEIYGGDLSQKPGGFLFMGAVLYAICQYADFSGGIDMMVAVSRMFGVEMNVNFVQPYFAGSIAEFWRRWHITLGSFMKDYVFYPFAVNRSVMKFYKKIAKRSGDHMARSVIGGIGNILVFLLVGLWHGPKLHFILWGLFNGVVIAVSDMCEPLYVRARRACHIDPESAAWGIFRIVRTFVIICFAGYFDYIENPADSLIAFKNTFLHFGPGISRLWVIDLFNSNVLSLQKVAVFALSVMILFTVDVMKEKKKDPVKLFLDRPAAVRWPLVYAVLILILMSFTVVGSGTGFMYAAF
ncbi:MAG: MBOAT family protein [Lachnospiraceae bacterium]|nr:MBOAT family protein [Lachnospiraceae bacterium]